MRTTTFVIALFCFGGNWVTAIAADRESLKGTAGVYVTVGAELQTPDTVAHLRTDTELELRIAGIQVPDLPPNQPGDFKVGTPVLHLDISAFKYGPDLVFSIHLGLQQNVTSFAQIMDLRRRAKSANDFYDNLGYGLPIYYGTTWSQDLIGIVSEQEAAPLIRNKVKDLVDQFVNDWLAANPKPAPNPPPK